MLEELSRFFKNSDIKFYVIGAVARDIIMHANGENQAEQHKTLILLLRFRIGRNIKLLRMAS
jgi:hypothetical protein